jgi:hypothetical protein
MGAGLCVCLALRSSDSARRSPQALQVIGFAINVVSVSIPGRFDSDIEPGNMSFPWPTLVSPAGFAFAIWAIIYIGEIAGMAVLVASKDSVAAAASPSSLAWLCANVAQCLWCASFRPWALERMWLSSSCLAATAFCLIVSQSHLIELCAHAPAGIAAPWQWALVIWPRSLHAGWVTAATLVNLNAWAGKATLGAPTALACAIMSLVGAVGLADAYAARGLALSALAVAWALFAVSKGEAVGADAVALGPFALAGFARAAGASALLVLASLAYRWAVPIAPWKQLYG